jgi:hypothetical protein
MADLPMAAFSDPVKFAGDVDVPLCELVLAAAWQSPIDDHVVIAG